MSVKHPGEATKRWWPSPQRGAVSVGGFSPRPAIPTPMVEPERWQRRLGGESEMIEKAEYEGTA
jgi:hypothetical protein